MEQWPNFFIVGAAKAGTTSLYSYLNNTPGVYMSPIKEPHYFNSDLSKPRGGRKVKHKRMDKTKYLSLFQQVKNEKAVGEASPSYLPDLDAAKIIKKTIPNSRIIIILRDPIERGFSHFLMLKMNGQEKRTFHEVITQTIISKRNDYKDYDLYLGRGLYYEQVKQYLDIFGSKQVKVLTFEEFIKDPRKTVKEILEFLGVDSEPPETISKAASNPFGVPRNRIFQFLISNNTIWKLSRILVPQSIRWKLKQNVLIKYEKKPEILKNDRLILEKFYFTDVKKLELLLKKKFPWTLDNSG